MSVTPRSMSRRAGVAAWALLGLIVLAATAARLFTPVAGIVAAATFAVLSLSSRLYGLAAYAEHFVLLPALAGALLLLTAVESGRLRAFFASGVLFGLALVIKQSGAAFVLFGVLYALTRTVSPAATGSGLRRLASTP